MANLHHQLSWWHQVSLFYHSQLGHSLFLRVDTKYMKFSSFCCVINPVLFGCCIYSSCFFEQVVENCFSCCLLGVKSLLWQKYSCCCCCLWRKKTSHRFCSHPGIRRIKDIRIKWRGKFRKFCFLFRVIMVVGAGRGPLVRASLTAAEESGRKVRIYAVEKNPNAVVTYVLQYCTYFLPLNSQNFFNRHLSLNNSFQIGDIERRGMEWWRHCSLIGHARMGFSRTGLKIARHFSK